MVRMSCLLGSPMITQEPGRSWPRQPGRAELQRLQPPGVDADRGAGCRGRSDPAFLDGPALAPPTAAAHALLALLAQIPPSAACACVGSSRASRRLPGFCSGRCLSPADLGQVYARAHGWPRHHRPDDAVLPASRAAETPPSKQREKIPGRGASLRFLIA